MANMAAKVVKSYFESKQLHVSEVNDHILRTGWQMDNTEMAIFFVFDDTDTHVHMEGREFLKVPEAKKDDLALYKAINSCNDQYVNVKFVLDEETGDIVARDDDIIQLDTCGEECEELMVRMAQIIDAAYPTLMKAIWS